MIRCFEGRYRFLSNFEPCIIHLDGVRCSSVEHAYQASKTLDPQERGRIIAAETAGKAKRLGQSVTVRPDWDAIKVDVMRGLLRQKFSQPSLRIMLIATGRQHIEEGNNWGDRFWGVDAQTSEGQNWLGRLLMEVRREVTR